MIIHMLIGPTRSDAPPRNSLHFQLLFLLLFFAAIQWNKSKLTLPHPSPLTSSTPSVASLSSCRLHHHHHHYHNCVDLIALESLDSPPPHSVPGLHLQRQQRLRQLLWPLEFYLRRPLDACDGPKKLFSSVEI